jgi:plasmid stabilization system protein ParE
VKLNQSATQDMEEIGQYIAETLKSSASAHNLNLKFLKAVKSLMELPHRCPAAQLSKAFKQKSSGEYRKLKIDNYLMLYQINETEKIVTITRVIYARMNYSSNTGN